MQKCNKCGEVKPLDQFYKDRPDCKQCKRLQGKAYRQANKDKIAAYCLQNREKRAANSAAYHKANKVKILARKAEYLKLHYRANKSKYVGYAAKRHAAKLKATPEWADSKCIQSYYDVANFFNEINGYIKYHVDHVVPLQGKNVSGLHVHQNLRVVLASENLGKSNKFEI